MPINFDGTDYIRDSTGVVTDAIGTHPGSDGEQFTHGYDYGSITEGLVAYYPMEEGQGQVLHDGALDNLGQINGATWNGSGQVGSDALSFDGTDDEVTSTTTTFTEPFTVSFWMNPDSQSTFGGLVGADTIGPFRDEYVVRRDSDGNYEIGIDNDGSGGNAIIPASKIDEGADEWYHIVATYNGSVAEIFLNSVSEDTLSFSSNVSVNSTRLGAYSTDTDTFYWSGDIDDVRIYDRALSEQEILALYNRTSPSGVEVTESDVPTQSDSGVSRYEFEGDVTDSWGSNDGTDNTSAGFAGGVFGNSKDFDGVDDRVELPDFGLSSSQSFTISCWVNKDGDIEATLVGRYDGTDDIVSLRVLSSSENDSATFRVGHASGNDLIPQGGTVLRNNWYHVLGTFDSAGPEASVYVDGSLVGSVSGTVDDFATGDGPWIGARTDGNKWLDGKIDDVRIYSKALSPTEVEQLYNKGAYRIDRGDVL